MNADSSDPVNTWQGIGNSLICAVENLVQRTGVGSRKTNFCFCGQRLWYGVAFIFQFCEMAYSELAGLEKGESNIAKEQLSDFNIPSGCDRFRLISAFCSLLQPPTVLSATAKTVELV